MRALRSILIGFMLLAITGGPWPILQAVAWTTMLANNLRAQPFSEAMTRTFDGQHPCNLCKAIAAGKKSEGKSEAIPPVARQEFLPVCRTLAVVQLDRVLFLSVAEKIVQSLTQQPPTPPPRAICA